MSDVEYVALYDDQRRPLGRIVPRHEPRAPGEYVVYVGVWIVGSDKRILLTRRSPEKRFAPNLWENTAGGVRAGETSVQAIIREVREEIGVDVAPEDVSYLGTSKRADSFGDTFCVRKDVPLSAVRLQPGETCDVKWVTLSELERMARDGELAPSIWEHMDAYRDAFYRIFD